MRYAAKICTNAGVCSLGVVGVGVFHPFFYVVFQCLCIKVLSGHVLKISLSFCSFACFVSCMHGRGWHSQTLVFSRKLEFAGLAECEYFSICISVFLICGFVLTHRGATPHPPTDDTYYRMEAPAIPIGTCAEYFSKFLLVLVFLCCVCMGEAGILKHCTLCHYAHYTMCTPGTLYHAHCGHGAVCALHVKCPLSCMLCSAPWIPCSSHIAHLLRQTVHLFCALCILHIVFSACRTWHKVCFVDRTMHTALGALLLMSKLPFPGILQQWVN